MKGDFVGTLIDTAFGENRQTFYLKGFDLWKDSSSSRLPESY